MVGGPYIEKNISLLIRGEADPDRISSQKHTFGFRLYADYGAPIDGHRIDVATSECGREGQHCPALRERWPLLESGQIKIVIDKSFPSQRSQKRTPMERMNIR
jgi:hypothetical protein